MATEKKKINISNPSFETIMKENCLYVDKTKYLYNLIQNDGQYYFLSRPRRFGKSLTVSTLEAIFKGKKELFKDLYIAKTDYDFKEFPVLRFDFSKCQKKTPKQIQKWLNDKILEIGLKYNIQLKKTADYDDNFDELIQTLSEKEKVVILIDEYDSVLTDNYDASNIDRILDVFRGFFKVLKASSDYVRFVFITGVTKYSNTGIFSAMNNLKDVSMVNESATMLGFTQAELEDNFKEYIDDALKENGDSRDVYLEKVKNMYDGYRFVPSGETLYNPVSINNFFQNGGNDFENYWVATGRTNMLADLGRKVKFNIDKSLEDPLSKSEIGMYDIVNTTNEYLNIKTYKSLLFQAGYLTISHSKNILGKDLLYLDYPNGEIREYFSFYLVNNVYSGMNNGASGSSTDLTEPLVERDTPKFIERMKTIYAAVPYTLLNGKKNTEADFHLMFFAMMKALGADIDTEIVMNKGRIDAVLKMPADIYVIEFKLDKTAEVALAQIKDKGYYEKYDAWKKEMPVHLIGINFSSKERNITDYKEEIVK